MKKFLLLAMMALSLNVMAGNEKGNGGVIVKCGESIQLAEFYEAKLLPDFKKLEVIYSDLAVEDQVVQALDRISRLSDKPEEYKELLIKKYHKIKDSILWLDGSYAWTDTNDLGRFPLEAGCEVKNVIHYFADEDIQGQRALFDKLLATEQAALYVHEVVYDLMRENAQVTTSLEARRLVLLLFSNYEDPQLLASFYNLYLMTSKNQGSLILNAANLKGLEIELTTANGLRDTNIWQFKGYGYVDGNKVPNIRARSFPFGSYEESKWVRLDQVIKESKNYRISFQVFISAMSTTKFKTNLVFKVKNGEALKELPFLIQGITGSQGVGNSYKDEFVMSFVSEKLAGYLRGQLK